jgi:lysozyme
MEINQATVDLVKHFEGKHLRAYLDPVGVLTIGYGYTNRAGYGPGVKPGDEWTERMAENMLQEGLERFGAKIQKGFKRKPTDNQYGAFVSLAYNVGPRAVLKSTALKRFNAGDDAGAVEAMQWFNKGGGKVLRGLVRRRQAEADLYTSSVQVDEPMAKADPIRENPFQATTLQAAGVTGAGGAVGVITALSSLERDAQIIVAVAAVFAAAGLLYIARERVRKWARGDR